MVIQNSNGKTAHKNDPRGQFSHFGKMGAEKGTFRKFGRPHLGIFYQSFFSCGDCGKKQMVSSKKAERKPMPETSNLA